MDRSDLFPVVLIAIICTAGCTGLMEKTFTLPDGTSGLPLSSVWEGAVEATGIDETSAMMSSFDLIMGGDSRVVLLDLCFSGEVDGERRHFNAYLHQDGTVTVRPIAERSLPGLPHPGTVFSDLEAIDPGASFGENDWTVHLRETQDVIYDRAYIPVYLMENRTLVPLDRVSTASARSPVFYLSVCKVATPDMVVKTEHGSGVGIRNRGGECFVIFMPGELENTTYKRV